MAANGAVTWWEIDVPDVARAQRFYGAITPWTLTPMEGMETYVFVTVEGTMVGALQQSTDGDPSGRGSRLYLQVADLEDTLAKVRQAGGTVEQERMQVPGDQWIGTARDPFGNRIGFATNDAAK
ncbi:MAG: VOC family protein [Actinomycetota bacterium]|nr:VOC family protein [Candidatus Dormibacteraeota bacterium]MDQ6945107.1 VOC family protein [Actinomycetota bacterium]